MIKLVSIFVISVIMSIGQLYADESNKEAEERVQHYQVDKPKTDQEALSILKSKSDAIEKKLLKKVLSSGDLEEIHEISYWLEAALDRLREVKHSNSKEEALDKLDEAVQAIHYSSENHKEIEVREWLIKLKSAILEVNDIF